MNLDDMLAAWRTQQAPLYRVDSERLRQAVRQELAESRRRAVNEARIIYGSSALMFCFMALVFVGMFYDDDRRAPADFAIAILGAAAFAFWGLRLYVSRRVLALRQRHLGASLRDEIEQQIAVLDYQIGNRWRPGGVLLTLLPMLVGTITLILAAWRINNEPFDTWEQGGSIFVMVLSVALSAWTDRRKAGRETLPRKRELEALLRELDAH
jgi:hypothetical protein